MDPLQQRVALLIGKKIDQNMEGLYPALTRLCLSMLGPYTQQNEGIPDSAWRLVERDIYSRLKKLPQLAKTSPDKLKHYLPPNVTFDVKTETLTHTYTFGSTASTILSELEIAPVSLAAFAVSIPASPPAK